MRRVRQLSRRNAVAAALGLSLVVLALAGSDPAVADKGRAGKGRAGGVPAGGIPVDAVRTDAVLVASPRVPSPSPSPLASPSPSPSPSPSVVLPPARHLESTVAGTEPLTLAFAGDVHFADQLAPLVRPGSALMQLRPRLAGADLAMVNLETAITTRGTPAPKTYHFRAPAGALSALAAVGVDVVTMANNHAVDYGAVGLADTLAARRTSPVPIVGIGADAGQAYAPALLRVRGRRVAVLAASQIGDWTLRTWSATADRPGLADASSPGRLLAAVRAARGQADLVVVYLHWGTEGETCPDGAQQRLAGRLAAAGADVVVGAHAHRVQGAGWSGSTFVDYGLGNFVWYNHGSQGSVTTGVLTLTVQGRRTTRADWTPLRIAADGVPQAVGAATSARMLASWNRTRRCTGLSDHPSP